MKLLAAVGITGFTYDESKPAELAALGTMLVDAAEVLVRAGYTPRLDDGLTRTELVALGEARERVAAEHAVLVGLASQGRTGAAAVLARSDGGDAAIGVALDRVHAETVRAAGNGKGGAE
jgi:hypothetical protein